MLEVALKVLNEITSHGFKAYIVGGFVRDYILGNTTNDVDICTDATPKDIKDIFENITLPRMDYGAVRLNLKKHRFDIMTLRKEISYYNNRKPMEVEYITDLYDDLKRRDFKMNTLCIDKDGNIIDLLNGKEDIDNRIITTVGDSVEKFVEDPLRILRAIRFYTTLDFDLSEDVRIAIIKTKGELSRLSYQRKKEELEKIFCHTNVKRGIDIIVDLELDKELQLDFSNCVYNTDLIGIWASIGVNGAYPFTKNEKDLIEKIREVSLLNNLDNKVLFKYGLYVNIIAGSLNGTDRKMIASKYEKLPIKTKEEVNITSNQIIGLLEIEPSKKVKEIYDDLINNILYGKVLNNYEEIVDYLVSTYK